MFINSGGSIEDYTRFETIMAEIYPRFHETKTAEKPYRLWYISI